MSRYCFDAVQAKTVSHKRQGGEIVGVDLDLDEIISRLDIPAYFTQLGIRTTKDRGQTIRGRMSFLR